MASTSAIVRPGSAPRSGNPSSSQDSSVNQRRPTYSTPSWTVRSVTAKRRPSTSIVPIESAPSSASGVAVGSLAACGFRGRSGGVRVRCRTAERRQELLEAGEERIRILDIGHVSAVLNHQELSSQRFGRRDR